MFMWILACASSPAQDVAPAVSAIAPPAAEPAPVDVVDEGPCARPGPECTCPDDGATPACFPAFDGAAAPLDAALRASMTGVSWKEGCPVPLDALSALDLPHWGLDGEVHRGTLIVATDVAEPVLTAFRALYVARFPIEQIAPVHTFGGSDDASMAANNTSAFNCRPISGGSSWSQHSYGRAIDVNPKINPYVRGARVLPPGGAPYVDRASLPPGGITADGPAVAAFRASGWGWGGTWSSSKDYQHFSESGR